MDNNVSMQLTALNQIRRLRPEKAKDVLHILSISAPDSLIEAIYLLENNNDNNNNSATTASKEMIELSSFLKANQRIKAIKALRAIAGIGLKEAKDFIDINFEVLRGATPEQLYEHIKEVFIE